MKYVTRWLGLVLAVAVLGTFGYYAVHHPELWTTLSQLNPWLAGLLLMLYLAFGASVILVHQITLELCRVKLSHHENSLLTMYSTLVNFFGPLQSGPGVRAVYLKRQHQLSFRRYALATLVYYALYGLVSLWLLLSGSWWGALLAMSVTIVVAIVAPRAVRRLGLEPRALKKLGGAVIVQSGLLTAIYMVELVAVVPGVSIGQGLAYTGTANLSLFAALTPGAIGIREAFLLGTNQLHHLGAPTILAASVIDRSVYIVYLLVLFGLCLGLHAKQKLRLQEAES